MSKKERERPDLPPPKVPRGQELLYLLAIPCSWLIPGAGHWLLGYRTRAVVVGAALLGVFWIGQHLADYGAVKRPVNKIFFWAQVGNGLSTLLSNTVWGQKKPELSLYEDPNDDDNRLTREELPARLRRFFERFDVNQDGFLDDSETNGVDKTLSEHHNTGLLFTSVSGLLNMLAILHVADPRTWAGRAIERRDDGAAGEPT